MSRSGKYKTLLKMELKYNYKNGEITYFKRKFANRKNAEERVKRMIKTWKDRNVGEILNVEIIDVI